MKRTIHLTALFSFVLLLSACSYRNNFVVVNKSGEAIEVQYRLKPHPSGTSGKFVEVRPPAKLSLKDFEAEGYGWKEVAKEQYGFDSLTGTFRVNVAPGEALLIDFAYNYTGTESEFNLAGITINGAKGSLKLEGRPAQTQFKLVSNSYVIEYE